MNSLKQLSFASDFGNHFGKSKGETAFIVSSGYEARSLHLLNKLVDEGRTFTPIVFAFSTFTTSGSRRENDRRLKELNMEPIVVSDDESSLIIQNVEAILSDLLKDGTLRRIIVDYSSMPRKWYCSLLTYFLSKSVVDSVEFWYVQGKFGRGEYPCVGYGDFKLYSGRPRVTQTNEVHVFGLGFDSIRTYGIWSFLDPQFTCCLIGESSFNQHLVERVHETNHEILQAANLILNVRLDDFPNLLSAIIDLAKKCNSIGDVCLIADGPKPLILAMSVAPIISQCEGLTSWHVSHVKTSDFTPIDVGPTDHVYGFSLLGSPKVTVAANT